MKTELTSQWNWTIHRGKSTWNTTMEVWFLGSLIFWGVYIQQKKAKKSMANFYKSASGSPSVRAWSNFSMHSGGWAWHWHRDSGCVKYGTGLFFWTKCESLLPFHESTVRSYFSPLWVPKARSTIHHGFLILGRFFGFQYLKHLRAANRLKYAETQHSSSRDIATLHPSHPSVSLEVSDVDFEAH